MAVNYCIPQAVPLPRPPIFARCVEPSSDSLGRDALRDLTAGEVLHITGGIPDGTVVYAVATDNQKGHGALPSREGWIEGSSIEVLPPQEASAVARIHLREMLKRVTLVRAEEDWYGQDDGCLPSLQAGELLQLGAVRDLWAYGWSLEQPSRRGWFPISLARRLDPSISSLISTEESEELPISSVEALAELLRSVPQPPRLSTTYPPDLPPAVAASAMEKQQRWEEQFAEIDAQEAAAKRSASRAMQEAEAAQRSAEELDIFAAPDSLPDDVFPLYVCKTPFAPFQGRGRVASGANNALLTLEVGDVVRVVSLRDIDMYCGFHEDKSTTRGWFPRRCVELLEDPLAADADAAPVGSLGVGPPPLPEVPPSLLVSRA